MVPPSAGGAWPGAVTARPANSTHTPAVGPAWVSAASRASSRGPGADAATTSSSSGRSGRTVLGGAGVRLGGVQQRADLRLGGGDAGPSTPASSSGRSGMKVAPDAAGSMPTTRTLPGAAVVSSRSTSARSSTATRGSRASRSTARCRPAPNGSSNGNRPSAVDASPMRTGAGAVHGRDGAGGTGRAGTRGHGDVPGRRATG